MRIQRICITALILTISIACGAVSTKESNQPAEATNTPVPPTIQPTEESQGEPFISGPNVVSLRLLTSKQSVGEKPLLQWEAIPNASYYQVAVFDESGKPYWAWEGKTAQIYLGGTQEQPPADSSGPVIAEGYSWAVIAYDAENHAIASSAVRSIAP